MKQNIRCITLKIGKLKKSITHNYSILNEEEVDKINNKLKELLKLSKYEKNMTSSHTLKSEVSNEGEMK